MKEILPVFTCFVQRPITQMQPLFLGRLTEGGQQLSQYIGGVLLQKELQRTHYCQIWQNRSKGWGEKSISIFDGGNTRPQTPVAI